MSTVTAYEPTVVIRREVDRFLEAARKRSEHDGHHHRRRTRRRHHRSWPLLVSLNAKKFDGEISAALHNASDLGVGFLSPVSMLIGSTVYVKLFSYDDFCPRVPAVVRHVTPTEHGYLVGCEFDLNNEAACNQALELGRHSRHHHAAY